MEKIGVQGVAKLARKAITQIASIRLQNIEVKVEISFSHDKTRKIRYLTFTFYDKDCGNCSVTIYDFYRVEKAHSLFRKAIEIAQMDDFPYAKWEVDGLRAAEEKELSIG